MYELEWTYVDDYDVDMSNLSSTPLSTSAIKYDFKNNATRIITDKPYYNIPIVYEDGYVVFRARIIRPDTLSYALPIYTEWSIPGNTGQVSSLTQWRNYFQIPQSHLSDSINWQYTVSFAEDGKYKQVMSYFDGSLKNRQTITRFNSKPNNVIATENIYDFKGRPSISILPTPTIQPKFGYIDGLSINASTQMPYKAADFDTLQPPSFCPGEFSISPLDTSALAYKYYSNLNSDQSGFQQFVPDAKGYPMVHSIIAPDNDRKIMKQGGAGHRLQMADTNVTRYYYTGANGQTELNRMFGTEIGKFEYYKKSVVVDPNRQTSIVISDDEGRTMATSLVGLGSDSTRFPIDPMVLPDTCSTWENLLYGITQVPVNNTWTANHNFFVEVEGYHTAQYSVIIPPFQPCPGWYLTIGASYDYKMTDQCGTIKMQKAETIGQTGVSTTPTSNSIMGTPQSAYLELGPYNLVKNMTYSMDSVEAAVDLFINTPGTCLYDQNYFIKQVVLGEDFPCALDTTNPCDEARALMKEELFPYNKYGDVDSAQINLVVLPQSGYSIFDKLDLVSNNIENGYRYQYCQQIQWPDTVWKNGLAYTNIPLLPVDTFIYIFNDTLAEALLPLHPEYCKDCDSAEAFYTEFLSKIPDYQTAEQMGYFTLADIVTNDPLYINHPTLEDSLKYPRFSDRRIDSLCIALAFCGGVDSIQVNSCFTEVFNSETSGGNYDITTAPAIIKQSYFEKLIPFYIGNRNIRKQVYEAQEDTATHCAPCDSFRMRLKPISVYGPQVYGVAGTDSAVLAELVSGFGDGVDLPGWMYGLIAGNSQDTAYLDSLADYMAQVNLEFCDTNVSHIAYELINCTTDTNQIHQIRDSLYNYYCTGAGVGEQITPQVVRRIVVNIGLALTDICNPYLVDYLPYPIPSLDLAGLTCKNYDFYTDFKAFLNSTEVRASITNLNSQGMMLSSGNIFQNQVISLLGSNSATIYTSYDAGERKYEIDVIASGDTLKLWLARSDEQLNVCSMSLDTVGYWEFFDVTCLKAGVSTVFPSRINEYSFIADMVIGHNGDTGICRMLGWNDGLAMMDTSIGEMYSCLTCPEMRAVYDGFRDTMNSYGVCCTDHPLYSTMLMNYVNYNLHKQYSWLDVTEFVKSCALADSAEFRGSYGHIRVTLSSAADAVTLKDYVLNTFDIGGLNYDIYRLANGDVEMLISLTNIPYNSLLLVKDYILSNYGASVYNQSANSDTFAVILLPQQVSHEWIEPWIQYTSNVVDVVDTAFAELAFSAGALDANNTLPFRRYVIKKDPLAPALTYAERVAFTDSLMRLVLDTGLYSVAYFSYDPMIGDDYYEPDKKDFLQYNYGLSDVNHYMLIKRLRSDSLETNIMSYNGRIVTYNSPYIVGDQSDLFISAPNQSTANLTMAKAIFSSCSTANTGRIFYQAIGTDVAPAFGLASGDQIKVYRCGDNKTFWYRFFKDHPDNRLYNLYIQVPDHI
ncbi:MAG TPA: hypothetical protein VEB40_14665, partial [Flavipsychrobacter sp.]|nr:hypothetical protein [Flavipsychrobacter sp.]